MRRRSDTVVTAMRILHTSDWHLGRVLHERSLLDDQGAFLDALLEQLRAAPHDVLVIAGDVFDRAVPPEDAVLRLTRFLADLRAACPQTAVVAIAGNHDSGARLAYGAPLLAATGVHLVGAFEADAEPVVVRAGGAVAEIWPVPFLWPGSLSSHRDGDPVVLGTQAGALEEAVARVRARRTPGAVQVLVAHCFARGGAVSDSERTLVGNATEVDAVLFEGFDYVALGHLHRPQRVTDNAWYAGSPLKYSFSEAGDAKCTLSVEVATGAAPTVTRVPVAQPREMTILRGTLRELLDDPRHAFAAAHYVRAELVAPEVVAQPVALLRARFPHLLDFRMPDPVAEAASPRAAARDRADVEADFLDFQRRVRPADDPLGPALLDAFRAVRARAEKAEGP